MKFSMMMFDLTEAGILLISWVVASATHGLVGLLVTVISKMGPLYGKEVEVVHG